MELIRAEYLEEGDLIVIDGVVYVITDIRENGRMNGIWVEYSSDPQCAGASRFFQYDDMVTVPTVEAGV